MESDTVKAICTLVNTEEGIKGVITLEEVGDKTIIRAKLSGLKPGKHGFHIHEFGNLTNGCITAGAHYNPYGKTHGGPDSETRHVGDLGNILADENGNAELEITDHLIKLTGPYSVIGRAFIIHAGEDDLGQGGNDESLKTGNAGARVVCGIIGTTNKF